VTRQTGPQTDRQTDRQPDAEQNASVLEDAQQLVVGGDPVEVGALLVGEEQIGLPDGVQHGGVQVQGVVRVLAVRQPRVVPLLPQEEIEPVVLRKVRQRYIIYNNKT